MLIKKALSILRARHDNQRKKRAFLSNKPLSSLYSLYKNSPEGHWIIGKNDAIALYDMVQKYQPMNILELGTGIGAAAAIMALASDARAKITTIEQFQKCVDIARNLTPQELQKKINFIYALPYAFRDNRTSEYQFFSGFKTLPLDKGPFDFLIIDGPGFWVENNRMVKLPNGDFIRLIPHLTTGAKIYIDGRKHALTLYKRFLKPYFRILEETKKYALLERTPEPAASDADLKIHDYELDSRLAHSNYFEGV